MSVFVAAKQISPADAARRLGLKESHGRFACPFHDDHHPSMACYENTRRFYCFTCHARGDATDLWARVRSLAPRAAAEEICAAYALTAREETKAEKARQQRVDAVAMLPQAVWQEWHAFTLTLLEAEVNACISLMERYPDPEGWQWQFVLQRATRLQDEMNRLKAIEPRLLAAEVAERRAAGEHAAIPDQPVMDEALLQAILADHLRRSGMHLNAAERGYVCRTLGIAEAKAGDC